MMKNKLVWRLGKLPSPDEVRELVKDKIITNEEAREILFSSEDAKEVEKKDLEAEIKFLRDLVSKLSNNQTTRIIETIKEVEKPYYQKPWYDQYKFYCQNSIVNDALMIADGSNGQLNCAFTKIKTF